MNIRNGLLSTALCGSLLAFAAGTANAATGQILQPDSNWAVSKIAAKQAGGEAYCALARRFQNDLVLTLARNSGEENSLALDFQRESLDKSKNYTVTVSPGGGLQRSFDIRPVSGRALVLRLGRDSAFYDAMGQSGTLEINVGDKSYAFSMPDMQSGQSDLDNCLASLGGAAPSEAKMDENVAPQEQAQVETQVPEAPAAPVSDQALSNVQSGQPPVQEMAVAEAQAPQRMAEAAPAVAPPLSAPPVPLRAPIPASAADAAAGEALALREENTRLRNALERERREFENKYMEQGSGSNQAAELNEKIRLLEAENANLKMQPTASVTPTPPPASCPVVAEAATSAVPPEELAALRAENVTLKQKAEALSTQLALAQQESAQKAALPLVDDKSKAEISGLQSRVQALESENTSLKDSLKTAQAAPAPAAAGTVTIAQLRSVEEQLKGVEAERDRLSAQIESMASSKEDVATGGISSPDWNLEQATRRFNEAEREIRRLGSEMERERGQCQTAKKEIEYKLFDPAIASQEQISKLMSLEEEARTATAALETQKADYEAKIAALQKNAADSTSKADAEAQKTAYESQLATIRQALSAREAELNDSAGRIAALQGQLETAQAHAARVPPVEFENIKQERDLLLKKVSVLEGEKGRLVSQLAQISSASGAQPVAANVAAGYGSSSYEAAASSPAPVSLQSVPVAVADIPPAMAAPVSGPPLMSSAELQSMLGKAHIALKGDVSAVKGATGPGFVAYGWETGSLFGSAEQQAMTQPGQFESLVQQYLDKTKRRCGGDFASVPGATAEAGGIRAAAFEIACMGGSGNASASLLFFSREGRFTAIAHESAVEGMDLGMDARDSLMSLLVPGKVVSN